MLNIFNNKKKICTQSYILHIYTYLWAIDNRRVSYVGMTPVASKMMRIMMIATMTPMIIIIFVFFHQYFRATRVDVLWNESACKETVPCD